ncbi:MAG: helix-turn-helix domain-containing protein [Solirubrobacteraceae bacterium]|nr:helix-turn-helix domain-containing protein [Solirubrobacteraceae bacterium]
MTNTGIRPDFAASPASDEAITRVVHALRDAVPAYEAVDDAELEASVAEIMHAVVPAVSRLEPPSREVLEPLETHMRRRVDQGFPLETLIRGVQMGTRELMGFAGEEASRLGLSTEAVLTLHKTAWDWTTYATEVIVDVHREIDVERVRHDSVRRAKFLRALLLGQLSPEQIQDDAPMHGLVTEGTYMAFRARPSGSRATAALAAEITRSGATNGQRVVLETVDGDLVGCAPVRPVVGSPYLVGLGSGVELGRLRESFADATQALDAAEAFGLSGAVDLIEVGPRSLALAADRPAARLDTHHFPDLDGVGVAAEIELTARTLLEHDQHVEATAGALHVHPNTVRYRMNRFRALTGLDLRRTSDLVTAWWLLNRRAAGRGPLPEALSDRRAGHDRRGVS